MYTPDRSPLILLCCVLKWYNGQYRRKLRRKLRMKYKYEWGWNLRNQWGKYEYLSMRNLLPMIYMRINWIFRII
jgi:hypothetical protein